MDTDLDLLFGVVAFQTGAVDAVRLAETCAEWVTEPTLPLANVLVDRGLITAEQRAEVEKAVAHELDAHGGDARATLAANLDSSSLDAIGKAAFPDGAVVRQINSMQGVHVLLDALLPAEESRDRYTLTQLHGRGGMGLVWLARDQALGRLIALKELRPDQKDNAALRSRFLYEAKITSQLEHPGIVPVYELCQGEAPYYTMRFVRGRTLSDAIRAYHAKRTAGQSDSIERMALLSAFVGVCHAMAYAHSRGIVHRDLKGQNVALGDFGEVMVLDWGLAKRIGSSEQLPGDGPEVADTIVFDAPSAEPGIATTVSSRAGAGAPLGGDSTITDSNAVGDLPPSNSTFTTEGGASQPAAPGASAPRLPSPVLATEHEHSVQGQILGTPAYMAPEQARGRHDQVDERTDVYGLGAILYEILTGRPPFLAFRAPEIIRKICEEAPTSPRRINDEVEPGLEAICLKALGKSPDDRYQSASELAQEIQRWLADLPVRAYREPWSSHAWRWARRHKTIAAAAAGLLVTATIALAVSATWVAVLRNEAETQGQQARIAVQLLTKVADIGFDDQLDPLQKEFLEQALAYYERFARRIADDPTVQQEHGRAYQQMGDIERKLRRFPQAERDYRRAIEILVPLADSKFVGAEASSALARTRTLLADLLVSGGDLEGRAKVLYDQAFQAQKALTIAPGATAVDQLRLGQTLKGQADLMRLSGQFSSAKPVYDQAIFALGLALATDPRNPEVRNDLANATDARGWAHRELGDIKAAERDFRGALAEFDTLLNEFPTGPRYRESLAKICNRLGLIEHGDGRLSAAVAHFRRELPLIDRLVEDFPDSPRHKRELARTVVNLANVLLDLGHPEEAEPMLVRAVEQNTAIVAANPRDVQVRLDLARSYTRLGEMSRDKGEMDEARASFRIARSIGEELVHEFPDVPGHRAAFAIAILLGDFGDSHVTRERSEAAEVTLLDAIGDLESLVAGPSPSREDRRNLAIAHAALGDLLVELNRREEAGPHFTSSVAGFESLLAEHAGSPSLHSYFGVVTAMRAHWLDSSGKPEEAKRALSDAIGHQRRAIELGRNAAVFRERLGSHMLALAWVDLALGADDLAAKAALDLPKTVPTSRRPRACLDAARVLARVVNRRGGDARKDQGDYERLTRNYVGRIGLLLREAIDADLKLDEPMKADAEIKRVASRPEYREIIRALIDLDS